MVDGDMVTQGARASAAMELTQFAHDIPISGPGMDHFRLWQTIHSFISIYNIFVMLESFSKFFIRCNFWLIEIYFLIEAEWRIYVSVNYTIIHSDNGLSPMNQWWVIVNWTLRNILQWNFIWKSKVFHSRKCIGTCRLPKWRPSCLSLNVNKAELPCRDLDY